MSDIQERPSHDTEMANPVEAISAEIEQGRGIMGVIDGGKRRRQRRNRHRLAQRAFR